MQPPFINTRLPVRDAWGRDKVGLDKSIIHGLWTFSIDPRIWLIYEDDVIVSSSTTVKSTDGMLEVTSNSNQARLTSRRHPRHQPNRGMLYSASVILPNYTANATRDWGLRTAESGVFFRLRNGTMYAVRRTLSTDFEEEIAIPTGVDLSKGCLYDIQMQWRGVGNIMYMISHNQGTTVHVMTLLGTLDAVSVSNPAMHLTFESEAGTDDATIYCGCVDVSSEGGDPDVERYASATATIASVSTGDPVISIRQPETINGLTNTRDVRLARIRISSNKRASFSIYTFRDTAAITATGWTAIGGGSYVEVVSGASITAFNTSLMQFVTDISIPPDETNDVANPAPETIEFFITHGEHLFLAAKAANTAEIDATIEFGEEV